MDRYKMRGIFADINQPAILAEGTEEEIAYAIRRFYATYPRAAITGVTITFPNGKKEVYDSNGDYMISLPA